MLGLVGIHKALLLVAVALLERRMATAVHAGEKVVEGADRGVVNLARAGVVFAALVRGTVVGLLHMKEQEVRLGGGGATQLS